MNGKNENFISISRKKIDIYKVGNSQNRRISSLFFYRHDRTRSESGSGQRSVKNRNWMLVRRRTEFTILVTSFTVRLLNFYVHILFSLKSDIHLKKIKRG